uniref:Uncharacterized protein n=1 Tax=Chrysotila carterae TaxID=13221 RepID=A0A7S4ERM5_CHRCT
MGLSNFGYDAGQYLGAEMLEIFGGVHAPDFENLELYVLIRTLMRLLPLALIPFLVPPGSPNSSATELGLAASISADVDGSSVGDCAEEMMPAPSTRGVVEAPMPRGDSAAKATDCEMAQGNREKDT